jgi:SAM-dependent methyltransferase
MDDRVRDALPVNPPYDGLVAEAYDVWMPPDCEYDDADVYRRAIERDDGPALELGCGNGRLLLRYVAAGLPVEGVDASADMLAICAAHAREAGLAVTLHKADWQTLQLSSRYATIYNPSGSFSLCGNDDDALAALRVWASHLRAGGRLVLSMHVPTDKAMAANWEWRLRRTGTRRRDGVTFVVHEALSFDRDAQTQHDLHRHEVWNHDGTLAATYLRRHALRWWTRPQLEAMLRAVGLVAVRSRGDGHDFVTEGTAP